MRLAVPPGEGADQRRAGPQPRNRGTVVPAPIALEFGPKWLMNGWLIGRESSFYMKSTIEINEANFEAEVLQSAVPVVVDFWAEWCGPCKMLAPVLEQVATELGPRVKVGKVDLDRNAALAQRYRVQAIPTLLYFAKGEVRNQTVGVTSKKAIVENLEALAPAA